jgi:hypothetical protein
LISDHAYSPLIARSSIVERQLLLRNGFTLIGETTSGLRFLREVEASIVDH